MKYVTYGTTESGDDIQIILWKNLPSYDKINETYKDLYPTEYEEVGTVNWKLMKVLEEK